MRRWWTAAAALLAVAVLVPVLWFATRPAADAGVPVGSVGAPSATAGRPSPAPSAATEPGTDPGTVGGGEPAVPVTALPSAVPAGAESLPVLLTIPALGVRAPIDPVGVQANGAMVIPAAVDRVGWYRFGSLPGDPRGAAVFAGHVDSKEQGPGALFRLRELGVGDRVQVRLADGRSVRYAVVGKETIVKKRLPTERLFARDGGPRLVLITCGGPFIPSLSSYQDNLVVVAEPVGAP